MPGAASTSLSPAPESARLCQPVAALSRDQQIILLKSSKVAGQSLLLWNSEQVSQQLGNDEHFVEANDRPISLIGHGWSWRRARDIRPDACIHRQALRFAASLYQTTLNDCAVVASLVACCTWIERFATLLVLDNIWPQNHGIPIASSNGRHLCRLFVNGAWRMIAVTDTLPVSPSVGFASIMIGSLTSPDIYWPALIEKAYLKLSRTFVGSHCASDTFMLTGWLPEVVQLEHFRTNIDELVRLLQQWRNGSVLLMVGSKSEVAALSGGNTLVGAHAYTVSDVFDTADKSDLLLEIRNPWRNPDQRECETQTLPLSEIIDLFGTLSINWHPDVWTFRHAEHILIQPQQSPMSAQNLLPVPKFDIKNPASYAISLLVVVSHHRNNDCDAPSHQTSLALHSAHIRVTKCRDALQLTDELVGRDVSFRISVPARSSATLSLIVRSVETPHACSVFFASGGENHDFEQPMIIERRRNLKDPQLMTTIEDSWSPASAGGPANCFSFRDNPSYHLDLDQSAVIDVVLESSPGSYALEDAIQVDIFKGCGIPTEITASDITATPAEYLCGLSHVSTLQPERLADASQCQDSPSDRSSGELLPGSYTVVPSTYVPGRSGPFRLSIYATGIVRDKVKVTRLPDVDAGRSVRRIYGKLSQGSASLAFLLASERRNNVSVFLHVFRKTSVGNSSDKDEVLEDPPLALRPEPIPGSGSTARIWIKAVSLLSESEVMIAETSGKRSVALEHLDLQTDMQLPLPSLETSSTTTDARSRRSASLTSENAPTDAIERSLRKLKLSRVLKLAPGPATPDNLSVYNRSRASSDVSLPDASVSRSDDISADRLSDSSASKPLRKRKLFGLLKGSKVRSTDALPATSQDLEPRTFSDLPDRSSTPASTSAPDKPVPKLPPPRITLARPTTPPDVPSTARKAIDGGITGSIDQDRGKGADVWHMRISFGRLQSLVPIKPGNSTTVVSPPPSSSLSLSSAAAKDSGLHTEAYRDREMWYLLYIVSDSPLRIRVPDHGRLTNSVV
ncbi:cysteine protease [Savitreella phatthalungensis]